MGRRIGLCVALVLAGCATGPGYRAVGVVAGGLDVQVTPREEYGYVVLELVARNVGERDVVLDLEDVVVLDGDGLVLRRLDPGEAAQMRLRDVKGAGSYPKKWRVRGEGDGLVVEEARSTEPAVALAEGFAEGFARSAERYAVEKADEVYRNGLGLRTVVPAGAGVRGWAYYLGVGGAEVRVGGERVALR